MRALRISAISFLNTAPLMWDFEHAPTSELTENFDITYTVPSSCARALTDGSADIGIIPAVMYAAIPDLVVIPDIAIAARGPVRSIRLVSKVPLTQVQTVAADTSSRTSVALTRVILNRWYGVNPDMVPMDPDLTPMLDRCDAALIIGDPALLIEGQTKYPVYDLAELWQQETGKPFVFAVWAVRKKALRECKRGLDVSGIFQHSRDEGVRQDSIATIARDWSPRLGLSEAIIESYLTKNIYYYLDEPCLDGLRTFYEYAAECGAIAKVPTLEFIGT